MDRARYLFREGRALHLRSPFSTELHKAGNSEIGANTSIARNHEWHNGISTYLNEQGGLNNVTSIDVNVRERE
jgi:hypothetical protein